MRSRSTKLDVGNWMLAHGGARYRGYFAISLISVGMVSILAGFQSFFVLLYGVILSVWFPHIIKEVINKKVMAQKIISIVLMSLGLYFIFA